MDDHTPPGEGDVFNMLASGPAEWVALHSLDLAPWNRSLRTEIDFVLIVPNTGILCIEVKSHERIAFENDQWHPLTIKRSPFKQALDGRHAFYRALRNLASQFRDVPVTHCCIFPRASFDLRPNVSVQNWELMDCRVFRAFRSGAAFCGALEERMRVAIGSDPTLRPLPNPLTPTQVESIVQLCAPVRRLAPVAREEIERRAEQVERLLREQQKPVLRLAEDNPRLIVNGGAGTGKTLIAMEIARRKAATDVRVALLCFNRMIGEWLVNEFEEETPALPNLVVGRAVKILAEMTGISIPVNSPPSFWDETLPSLIEEKLTDPDFKTIAIFDVIVVDEAQDILARPRLWQCIQQFLANGMEGGSFILFGDFDNQVLTDMTTMKESLNDVSEKARPAKWRLSENCRNYEIIGNAAVQLSGFSRDVYSGFLRGGGGIQNYDISFYQDVRGQTDQLGTWLSSFKAQGYKASEITVLSFRNIEECAAAQLKNLEHKMKPVWKDGSGTPYTTVHGFKGMENKVIILTDVLLGTAEFHRHLFYIGITRATESVRVLCDIRSKSTLLEWITKG